MASSCEIKIVVVSVLYNQKYDEVKYNNEYEVFYLDNSTVKKIKEYNFKNENVIDMKGNVGLSKAYNKAIDLFVNSYDYMLILDDDSMLEKDFINKLHTEIKNDIEMNKEYDFYLPEIYSAKTLKKEYPKFHSNSSLKHFLNIKHKRDLKTINSGLVIKLTNKTEKFNEKFFLYCVDYEYCERVISKKNYKFSNLKLYQNFSRESEDYNALKNSTKLVLADSKKYYSKTEYFLKKIYCDIKLIKAKKYMKGKNE